jgi:hypothetical protein
MSLIQGGVIVVDGVPRPVDPFGRRRVADVAGTAQAAIDAAQPGDTVYLQRGEYDEDIVIPSTKSGINIVGVGARGTVRITGLAPNGSGVTINGASDITLINLNMSGRGTGSGLKITGNTRRIVVAGCRMAGGANGLLMDPESAFQHVDTRFIDCIFASATTGARLTGSGGADPISQTVFKDCYFYYCAERGLYAPVFQTGLLVENCTFGVLENGDDPANFFIDVGETNTTGMVTACRFASESNTLVAGKLRVASTVRFIGNHTLAGLSVAQPVDDS